MPELTVAICTFNNAPTLRLVLEALARQRVAKHATWETIVIDNNSTDDTPNAVAEAQRLIRIPSLRYSVETKQGLTYARGRALREARSPLIAFVDDDCLLDENWVQNAIDFARRTPAAAAFGGVVELEWAQPPTDLIRQHAMSFAARAGEPEPRKLPDHGYPGLVGAGLVVRKDAVETTAWIHAPLVSDRIGKALDSGGDDELLLHLRHAGHELWWVPDLRLRHLIPARRMTAAYLRRLYQGIGRSDAVLCLLARGIRPTHPARAIVLAAAGVLLVWETARYGVARVLRAEDPVERSIWWRRRIGFLQGAWRAMQLNYASFLSTAARR